MSPTTPWTDIYPDGPPGSAAAAAGAAASGSAGNLDWPGMPAGATPFHAELALELGFAGPYDVWTPPADKRAVVASCQLSTDSAMRLMLVDGVDGPGTRIAGGWFAANGGLSANLVPVPHPCQTPGVPVRIVLGDTGNVFVRVSGWTKD